MFHVNNEFMDPAIGGFNLANALVLATGELDKMREMDRVAIQEAMEQQTISVAMLATHS